MKESFYFSGNATRLLVDGLTFTNTKDLIIFLTGLVFAAFLVESLQRISRECYRKVPRLPGQRDNKLKRRRSDRFSLRQAVDETRSPSQEEEHPWFEMGERNGHVLAVEDTEANQDETICCRGGDECGGELETREEGKETTSLVGKATCCLDTPEPMTEEQKATRLKQMWKSLSLEVLNDRWEIYQTTCEERNNGRRVITWSYRVAFHILQTVISMVRLTMGYLFMLIIMTYNVWFLICVVVGAGLGYLLFSADLETLYADYAECYIMRKAALEDAKQKTCSSARVHCCSPKNTTQF